VLTVLREKLSGEGEGDREILRERVVGGMVRRGTGASGSEDIESEKSDSSFGESNEYVEKFESMEKERAWGVMPASKSAAVTGNRDQSLLHGSHACQITLMSNSLGANRNKLTYDGLVLRRTSPR
jgi:hypothetical protein